jgi:hypothetical protein
MLDLSGEGPAVSCDEAAFAAMAVAATDGFGEEPLEDDMRGDTDPAANLAAEDGSGEDTDDDLDVDPGFHAAESETQDGLEAAIAEALDAHGARGALRAAPRRRGPARGATGAWDATAVGQWRRRGACPASQEGASGRTGTRGSLTEVMRRLGRLSRRGHR